jgi:hypothetical protein
VGCYSQKAITYKEFYNLQNVDEALIHTSANKSIKLTTDSLKNSYVKWNAYKDSIIVWSTQTVRDKNYSWAVSDTIKLSSSEIDKVYVDEFDVTKTIIAIAIPIAFFVITIAVIGEGLGVSGNILGDTHL